MILNRRVKGTPSHFAARLLDHFRSSIRERLLSGRLASHGIIDRKALEKALAGERPVPDLERVRILELVNCENWIEHWAARTPASQTPEASLNEVAPGRLRVLTGPTP
jgi:asparagine synthase (glutamine-hydrolysing)